MKQLSFSDVEYGGKRKRTRREVFLAAMQRAVPWARLEALIAPHYPKAGNGLPPLGLEKMLRITFCRSGSTFLIPVRKKRSTTASR